MKGEPLFIFQPRSVLAIVSVVWAAAGPVLSIVLSLFALTFNSWFSRLRGSEAGTPAANGDDEPFLRFSRAVFGAYALVGMIIIPSFVYILLSALVHADRPNPFPAVLLINSANLIIVFGYGLFCHVLAARLRSLFNRRM